MRFTHSRAYVEATAVGGGLPSPRRPGRFDPARSRRRRARPDLRVREGQPAGSGLALGSRVALLKIVASKPKPGENKTKQNSLHLLFFTFPIRDFSMGYAEKNKINSPPPCLPCRRPLAPPDLRSGARRTVARLLIISKELSKKMMSPPDCLVARNHGDGACSALQLGMRAWLRLDLALKPPVSKETPASS